MKTIKTFFPILLVLLFTGIGILNAQPETTQDSYLDTQLRANKEENPNDIPLNKTVVSSEALFQKLVKTTFSHEEEERVNDIPFNTQKIAEEYLFQKVIKSISQEEAPVDDIPPAILKAMKDFQQKRQVNATDR